MLFLIERLHLWFVQILFCFIAKWFMTRLKTLISFPGPRWRQVRLTTCFPPARFIAAVFTVYLRRNMTLLCKFLAGFYWIPIPLLILNKVDKDVIDQVLWGLRFEFFWLGYLFLTFKNRCKMIQIINKNKQIKNNPDITKYVCCRCK